MIPASWIDALFEKFESFYGAQFVNKWKNTNITKTKLEWAEALGRFDGDILKQAVDYCRENITDPPSLPHFVSICKSFRPVAAHKPLMLTHEYLGKTPHGLQMIADIKEMLKQKRIV